MINKYKDLVKSTSNFWLIRRLSNYGQAEHSRRELFCSIAVSLTSASLSLRSDASTSKTESSARKCDRRSTSPFTWVQCILSSAENYGARLITSGGRDANSSTSTRSTSPSGQWFFESGRARTPTSQSTKKSSMLVTSQWLLRWERTKESFCFRYITQLSSLTTSLSTCTCCGERWEACLLHCSWINYKSTNREMLENTSKS